MDRNEREEMLLDTDRDKTIDLIGKECLFFVGHLAFGHKILVGSPGPLRLKYAVGSGAVMDKCVIMNAHS